MKRRMEKPTGARVGERARGPLKEERGRGRAPINFSSLDDVDYQYQSYKLYLCANTDRHFRAKFETCARICHVNSNISL